jgi:histidinol dehydrogenase
VSLTKPITVTVREILTEVRQRGDDALLEYTYRFDRLDAACAADLEIPVDRLQEALAALPSAQHVALDRRRDPHPRLCRTPET